MSLSELNRALNRLRDRLVDPARPDAAALPEDGQHDGAPDRHDPLEHDFTRRRWLAERDRGGTPHADYPLVKFQRVWMSDTELFIRNLQRTPFSTGPKEES